MYKNKWKNTGFTIIEMMVSVTIITIILSVVLFNYKDFNDNLALSSAQQEISIAIRQAQIYGLSVKENKVGTGNFNTGYGVYVNMADPTNYYLFSDQAGVVGKYDGTSDCPGSVECVEKDPIRNGVRITNICAAAFGGSLDCMQSLKSMHITFIRPNPDASIRFINSSNNFTGTYKTGQIILTSPLGKTAKITIENTGQISVQ